MVLRVDGDVFDFFAVGVIVVDTGIAAVTTGVTLAGATICDMIAPLSCPRAQKNIPPSFIVFTYSCLYLTLSASS
jgi:hypothetical protein